MNYSWATIYGFIQGLSEFLPVSSSGHLAIIPFLFELKDPGVVFDLMMHVGTALAVIIYFWRDVLILLRQTGQLIFKRETEETCYIQNFLLATIASFGLILVLKKFAFDFGRTPQLIAFNLIFFGVLMYVADRMTWKKIDLISQKNFKTALIIGLSQSIAVFPGVSRSGITLTASRFLKMDRVAASRFSFLLSLPVIIGSAVFKLPDVLGGQATYVSLDIIFIGVISSFVFGLLTIHFFLKLISKIGLGYFSLYRVILGVGLLYFSLR